MKDPERDELISKALREELSRSEQEHFDQMLSRDRDFRADWEIERSLDNALSTLPNAPVSSNFTSLVLQAALKPERPARPQRKFSLVFLRFATGLAVFAVVAVGVMRKQQHQEQRQIAEAVNAFSGVASAVASEKLPSTEVFKNFDAIQRLALPAESELDMELLVALQK